MSPARFGQRTGSRPPGRWRRLTAAAAAVAVLPVVGGAAMPAPPHGAAAPNSPLAVPAMRAVPVRPVPARHVRVPVMRSWRRPAVTWPAPGVATALIGPRGAARTSERAGSLPVWVSPAARPGPRATASARVAVRMLPRQLAARLGVTGVVFTLARADGRSRAAAVHVSLDFRSFAYAAGGGFSTRLHLVELPACALATPGAAACRRQAPVSSADDALGFWLGADVRLPGATGPDAAPQVVLAATTAPSGSGGDFTSTPLSEAGTWQAGGSSGAFTYDIPIAVPPVPGGLAPDVALMYDSQAVDGLTSATNSQASWIGDGWDYQPGYIERDYQSCEQTSAKTGDLCWSGNNVTTLSLGGRTTTLVDDPSTGWRAEADSGDKVQYLTGTSNGTNDGGYWVITDPSGTKYYFGLNQLPGWASGDATTNSAWTVPVYAASSGQPCYNSTFSKSHCPQAWRWNLDYVVDSHSDAEALFYKTATNYYAADKGTTGTASYVRAGALTKIEYGLRDGAIYGVTPAGQVSFTTVTTRTDIPSDLACSSGASCNVISPTFWSKYQLTTISTQAREGTALVGVDEWDLSQSFPATGDGTSKPPMWLDQIQRTGQDGPAVTPPPVKFAGVAMPNRAETPTDQQDGYSLYDRFRLTSVTSETGGVTAVTYDSAPTSCTSGNFPAEDASTTVCYPDWWTPPGASSPILDWFNKYVVTGVTQSNTVGGATPVTTRYCYGSTSNCLSSAAWHYNDDALTRSKNRTWDQWRGFGTVYTYTGTAPDPVTETKDRFFQGMDGNFQSGGGTSSASLASTLGSQTVTDSPQFAGMSFEHTVYDGSGGAMVSDTVTVPWASAATATHSQPSPLPPLQAFMTGTAETKSFTALAAGGKQEADATFTHDSLGRVTSVSDVPDVSDPSQDTCATTSYPSSTSNWILDLPSEVQVVAKPCGTAATLPLDAVSDTRYLYDGSSTLGAEPSVGNLTKTRLATSYSGSTPSFTTESTKTYDLYGRVTSASDADNRATTTAFSPSSGAEPTSVTVTDPMNLTTTTTYDPARDLPLTVTNPAGLVTTKQYDALGRLAAAWTPGHVTSGPADATFSYTVSQTGSSYITTNTITASGSSVPSITLFDSLGRQIETQTQTPDGGRDVSDTFYNSDGWKMLGSDPYFTTGAPSGTLVQAGSGQVPSQTGWFYDGAGRVMRQVAYSHGAETWETDTAYGGNYTTVTPPAGGTPQTTYTDGRGLTQFIYQYHGTPPASPPAPGSGSKSGASGWNQTSYTYTPARRLATVTDAVGNQWSYSYDLAGDTVSVSDPDSGSATMTYDSAGQLTSVRDARGKTISYTYDADGRKTARYDTTGGAAQTGSDQLAAWTYDTLAKGQPTSSVAYGPGGTAGTTYTQGITGYNTFGLPSGTSTAISAGPLAGTYKRTIGYTSYADLVSANHDFAVGGLPDEQINYSYDGWNSPAGVSSSLWTYVASLTYTELGQPQEFAFGTTTSPAWLTNTYDQQTGRLNEALAQTGSQSGKTVTVDDASYAYDNFGNITSEADAPPGGPSQVQCYHYDYLARLTQAWSQAATPCAASPSQSAEGGAAPYWNSYAYDSVGDLTGVTSTPPSGQATVTTSTFPAAGSPQPHAPVSQAVTGPAGNSTTSFSYDASGHLASSSGGASQTLSWDDGGRLTSDRTAAGTVSYVYDADGNLLLQTDPGGVTTLYLPDEQITTDGTTTTGVRYYALGGATVAARASSGSVSYLIADQHGTANLAIDSQSLAVTRRYYDPFGNPIGAQPSSWPGTRAFVGGTADSATGLTNLGAREYSPGAGEFISPDPVINPYVPQDLNGYAYASDNPVTYSDPTGLVCIPGFCVRPPAPHSGGGGGHGGSGGGGCCAGGGGGSGGRTYPAAPPPNPKVLEITHVTEILDPPIRVEAPHQAATSNGSKPDCLGPEEPASCQTGHNLFNARYNKNSVGDILKKGAAEIKKGIGVLLIGGALGGLYPGHVDEPHIPTERGPLPAGQGVTTGEGGEGKPGGGGTGPGPADIPEVGGTGIRVWPPAEKPTDGEKSSILPLLPGINPLINYTTIESPLLPGINPRINFITIDPGWSWLRW